MAIYLGLISLMCMMVLVCGCGSQAVADISAAEPLNARSGVLHNTGSSTDPVLQLFAVSTAGKGTTASLLATRSVKIDSSGYFPIAPISCPSPDSLVYAVVTTKSPNSSSSMDLSLMNILSTCKTVNAAGMGFIDEATTVMTASALAPYLNAWTDSIAGSSSDAASISATFATLATIESALVANGPLSSSLSTTTVEKIFSLSDLMAACRASTTGALCTQFAANAAAPGSTTPPTGLIAALQQIFQNPTHNAAAIYNLVPSGGVYQPSLTAAPTDWSLAGLIPLVTPTVAWPTPAAITYGTALSAAQLNASSLTPGTFSYSPAVGTTPSAGANVLSTTFTPADGSTYSPVTQTVTMTVNPATPAIVWPVPASMPAGTPLSQRQLDAQASVPGTYAYNPGVGALLKAGPNILRVLFTPADAVNYIPATQAVTLTVNSANSASVLVNWPTPAPITYGTALSATQLNASSLVPGSFTYTPAAGTQLSAGTQLLSVKFTPLDLVSYIAVTQTVNLTVNQATPVVNWTTPAAISAGTALSSAQLNASSNVPGAFAYSPALGTQLSAGTQVLSATFTPTDGADYAPVTKTVSLMVSPALAIVNWATPAPIAYGTALSTAQLNATSSVPGTFAYTPAAGAQLTAGTKVLSVIFTPSSSAAPVTKTVNLMVNQATPVVTWATPAAISAGTALSAAQLNASSSVPGSFAYSPAAGTQLSAGTQVLSATFTPTDAVDYVSATKTVSLTVNASYAVVNWATPAAIVYGTTLSSAQLDATSTVPGAITYSPAAGARLTAGTQVLSATFTPTDTQTYSTATKTVSLIVNPATPAITWLSPAAITAGTALSGAQLNASSTVPGVFTYSPALGTVLSSGTTILTANFKPTDTTDYVSASATVGLTVNGSSQPPTANPQATNIAIGSTQIQTGVKRFGMNIAGQNYYDSGQMLRNLVMRNPGFEGQTLQSILECGAVTATSCTEQNEYTVWPAGYLNGATFEFIYGAAKGATGVITSSTAASGNLGVTMNFAATPHAPAVGDFVIVKKSFPGNGDEGWWTNTGGGGAVSTETTDLSPNTPGKQALLMNASGSGQSVNLDSYFDSTLVHSFVQLKGTWQVSFRAKGAGGSNQMTVKVARLGTGASNETFLTQTVPLTGAWQDYTFDFSANEDGTAIGTLDLGFAVAGASVMLDDVSLTPATATSANPTPFRDEVVSTLQSLRPGVLRYMDSGTDYGSSIDNMIAVSFARQRAVYSTQDTTQEDVPLGLHEFLQLCQTVGSEPWYTMPAGMSTTEMQNLIQYLAGDPSTPYGAIRARLGQSTPWTSVFPVIHLELGNEVWNQGVYYGAAMSNPVAYGNRVATIFGAAKSSPSYVAGKIDLVMGSQAVNPDWTNKEMASSSGYDTVAVAPYLFNNLSDTSSLEAIYGPMFAEPEMVDSNSSGYMAQQAQVTGGAGSSGAQPANLAVYEVNLATQSGTASQAQVNQVVPSLGGGLAVADHLLLMIRDLGIKTQNVWSLPGVANAFYNSNSSASETTPLYGTVIDMGGSTNLRRPAFLAEQLANSAILPTMLGTTVTGANPTWNQPLSQNGQVQLQGAHDLQSFAFTDGTNNSLVVINLSRTSAQPITISGKLPQGAITVSTLTSPNLTDSNESTGTVAVTSSTLQGYTAGQTYSTPAYSMTVFTWTTSN